MRAIIKPTISITILIVIIALILIASLLYFSFAMSKELSDLQKGLDKINDKINGELISIEAQIPTMDFIICKYNCLNLVLNKTNEVSSSSGHSEITYDKCIKNCEVKYESITK
jgi:hypothetical protein